MQDYSIESYYYLLVWCRTTPSSPTITYWSDAGLLHRVLLLPIGMMQDYSIESYYYLLFWCRTTPSSPTIIYWFDAGLLHRVLLPYAKWVRGVPLLLRQELTPAHPAQAPGHWHQFNYAKKVFFLTPFSVQYATKYFQIFNSNWFSKMKIIFW